MALPIKELVNNIFGRKQDWRLQIIKEWSTIMGPLHKKVSLEKIENETAYLSTTDSCWLTELYMFSELIKKNMNNLFDQPRIKRVRFSLKTRQEIKLMDIQKSKNTHQPPRNLSTHEKQALSTIKDAQLQKALEHFLQRCKYNDPRE